MSVTRCMRSVLRSSQVINPEDENTQLSSRSGSAQNIADPAAMPPKVRAQATAGYGVKSFVITSAN